MEQLDYNLLFRRFVGLNPDDPVWHPTTFIKNRDRLLNEELIAKFLELLWAAPEVNPRLSSEHFSVDGTCYGLGPPTARRSGSTGWMTIRHRLVLLSHQVIQRPAVSGAA